MLVKRISVAVSAFLFLSVANAASIQYGTTSGLLRASYGDSDGFSTFIYYREEKGIPDTASAYIDSASGTYTDFRGDFSGSASADFSSLDATGFSLTTETAIATDADLGGFYESMESLVIRTIEFSLSEQTELLMSTIVNEHLHSPKPSLNTVYGNVGIVVSILDLDDNYNRVFSTFLYATEPDTLQSSLERVVLDSGNYQFSLEARAAHRQGAGSALLNSTFALSVVPVPAAVWLFGSALFGLICLKRKGVA